MSKLAIVHERTSSGDWKPVGVILGTLKRLDFKFLPGDPLWDAWASNAARNASRPYLDGSGTTSLSRGTWEDWVVWAVGAFSNGADRWFTLIDTPEPTVEQNYRRYVLKTGKNQPQAPAEQRPTDTLPPLEGYKKVSPA